MGAVAKYVLAWIFTWGFCSVPFALVARNDGEAFAGGLALSVLVFPLLVWADYRLRRRSS